MKPIDLASTRAKEARLAKTLGRIGYRLLVVIGSLLLLIGILLAFTRTARYLLILASPALLCLLPAIWWKKQLSVLPPSGQTLNDRLSGDLLARLRPGQPLHPKAVWQALSDHWQSNFFMNHLLINREAVNQCLNEDEASLIKALEAADHLARKSKSVSIEPGFLVAGLMMNSPEFQQLLSHLKLRSGDVEAIADWLGRNLELPARGSFGGVGRDWAFGFTPLLDRYGLNLSRAIMKHGAHFDWLTESAGVRAIEAAFANNAAAVAVIGPFGIGKTQSIYALAQKLIEGGTVPQLAYHQIIELNATDITSRAHGPGQLEHIMLRLANEAAHARHIILFLDDARAFLNNGPGAFDASQILLSIVGSRGVPIIMALEPNDYQRLRATNASLAGLLTPVMLQEPDEDGVMRVLEDTALSLESRHRVLVAYEALREAYRLSGLYEQEEAYPGKAIKLLEQAVTHADHSVVTAVSVQVAIEETRGVKATSAAPAEADKLLHLEDDIHRRMINQNQAVAVVSNALRRARAGVTNPKRPIGSFLFLGPTGVGKTELAKAVAATYFGSESSMIRLDMSEYSRESDVQRLLATGQQENASLLMSIRQQPFAVVLLDEIDKAHPSILNLLMQMLDEGHLTDTAGRQARFKDSIIIATSNAGANTIRERIARGDSLESFASQLTDELINSGQFKPELLNRFDEMVLFRPLTSKELSQVAALMVQEINSTLANQNISIELTAAAISKIVAEGNDPRLGARPMRHVLQKTVENTVAKKILAGAAQAGDHIILDEQDLEFN